MKATPPRVRKATIHTRNIPEDLKPLFKSYCARRGYTMESAIVALMRKATREDLVLPDARKTKGV